MENGPQEIKGRGTRPGWRTMSRIMQECDACLTPVNGYKERAGWDGKSLTM